MYVAKYMRFFRSEDPQTTSRMGLLDRFRKRAGISAATEMPSEPPKTGKESPKPAEELSALSPDSSADGKSASAVIEAEAPAETFKGVVFDEKLIPFYFRVHEGREVQPVVTDKFLNKSKAQYNTAWLAREIVQNFVDHNRGPNKGTLNGVSVTSEQLPASEIFPHGGRRFVISGEWPFEDTTGLTSMHSEKSSEGESAGGNGIGLKQTVLRYIRDFGVQRFEVAGEGWQVDYSLARKDQINARLLSEALKHNAMPTAQVKHDWLVAEIKPGEKTGKTFYSIDTDNAEVIASLEKMSELGESRDNPWLQNPNFSNDNGTIKWLPLSEKGKEPEGRLFINGQVMNFKQAGKTAENYWRGPEGVSIALHNVKYEMSIDRPPVPTYGLENYMDNLIKSMTKEEILGQLRESEYIWGRGNADTGGFDTKGCFVLIKKLAEALRWGLYKNGRKDKYSSDEFAVHFPKKYLAVDARLSDSQHDDLEKRGFILCPNFFEDVGMPKASGELSSVEVAKTRTPQSSANDFERLSKEKGIPVSCESMEGKVAGVAQFFKYIRERMSADDVRVNKVGEKKDGEGKTVAWRFDLPGTKLPKELLFSQLLKIKKGDKNQELLSFVRGAVLYGLKERIFKNANTAQGEYVTTFSLTSDAASGEDGLLVLNSEAKTDGGFSWEVELDENTVALFEKEFFSTNKVVSTNGEANAVQTDTIEERQPKQVTESPEQVAWHGESSQPAEVARDIEVDLGKTIGKKAERKDLRERMGKGEEVGGEQRGGNRDIKEIIKPASAAEAEKIDVLAAKIPELAAAVRVLAEVAHEGEKATKETKEERKNEVEKYLDWKESDNFYGKLAGNADYLNGKTLVEIFDSYNQADIPVIRVAGDEKKNPEKRALARISRRLEELANAMAPAEEKVEDFELVFEPTDVQLTKLGLLRSYFYAATGARLPNDLFVFRGTGTKAINIAQRAIGIHEEVLAQSFDEAVTAFVHEAAHNKSMNHDVEFMHMLQALFGEMRKKVSEVGRKIRNGSATPEEQALIDMDETWGAIDNRV